MSHLMFCSLTKRTKDGKHLLFGKVGPNLYLTATASAAWLSDKPPDFDKPGDRFKKGELKEKPEEKPKEEGEPKEQEVVGEKVEEQKPEEKAGGA